MPEPEYPLRVVLAKVGLDGHDRGIKVVARALRDAGMHVIYAGLWQAPEAVVRTVADEDADWLGLSLLSGAHMTLVPRVMELLRQAGLEHVGVLVGGIVPEDDVPKLHAMGVAKVFGPGTPLDDIVAYLRQPREERHAGTAPGALPQAGPPRARPAPQPGGARRRGRGDPRRRGNAGEAGARRGRHRAGRRRQEQSQRRAHRGGATDRGARRRARLRPGKPTLRR